MKKKAGMLTVRLAPTVDIARRLGRHKGRRVLVGFALEDHHHRRNAEAKLRDKGCDAIVLNRVDVIGAEDTQVEVLLADNGWGPPQAGSKPRIAGKIIGLVEQLAHRKRTGK
jgi:phosphopantothenoylcysteine decarboxylase/phosphopantothenate--cysteine ligase